MAGPWEKFADDNNATAPWEKFSGQQPRPRLDQSYAAGIARTALGQGTLFGLGDEAVAGLRAIGGESYDEALADERARVAQFRDENPKTALAGEMIGSMVTPGLGLAAGAIKPALTAAGRIAQGVKLGGGYGAAYGFASGEGGDGSIIEQAGNRLANAGKGLVVGSIVGGALPAAGAALSGAKEKASAFLGPTIARATSGVEKAADKIMANRIKDAGDTPAAIRKQLAEAEESGRFYSNSRAAVPMALVDASPAMQKLAGSASRSSTEANARAEAFFGARQTGVTPKGDGAQKFVEDAGLETRNPFAKVAESEGVRSGQFERIRDALHRAFTIKDKDFHEFGDNAYRTEKNMMTALKGKAQSMFPDAYKEAQPFDLTPAFSALDEKMADRAGNHLAVLNRARKLFLDPKSPNGAPLGSAENLKRFQSAKEMLDDVIETAMRAGKGKLAGDLTEFRRNLTASAKAQNPKYQQALDYYSSQMDLKEAIDLGRRAFKEGNDLTVDQFRALTEGEKKLFRLGMLESYETQLGRGPRANDRTRIFEQPQVQELLSEVIPRTETATGRAKAGAVFADRPQRFGDFIANEKAMVRSRDKVIGGSPTQERAMEDAKFTRQGLGQMIDRLRGQGGLTGVALEATSAALNKVFGMREDVASEIGRRLFVAKPAEREAILQRLEAIAPAQMPKLKKALSNINLAASTATAGQAAQSSVEVPRLPSYIKEPVF